MTRDEVLKKLQEARKAIEQYKKEGLNKTYSTVDIQKVREIEQESTHLITEVKAIGASGKVCPHCGGSGRV